MRRLRRLQRDRGATLVEYALIMSLVVVVLAGAVAALQDAEAGHLESSGERIGMPDLDASPTPLVSTTSVPDGSDPTTPPPSTVTILLDPPPVGIGEPDGTSKWKASVTLSASAGGLPVAGVVISGTWTPTHATQADTSCTTDAGGTCTVVRWNLNSQGGNEVSAATFTVEGISGPGYIAGSGTIGTSVTVYQPGTEPPPEEQP